MTDRRTRSLAAFVGLPFGFFWNNFSRNKMIWPSLVSFRSWRKSPFLLNFTKHSTFYEIQIYFAIFRQIFLSLYLVSFPYWKFVLFRNCLCPNLAFFIFWNLANLSFWIEREGRLWQRLQSDKTPASSYQLQQIIQFLFPYYSVFHVFR